MDDNRIIELFFERNELAIERTQEKFGRLTYRIAHNVLGDEHDVEEAQSDTYLALWNSIPPERPKSFIAYVAKIARNVSLKRLEYNLAKKRSKSLAVSMTELEEAIPDKRISDEVEAKELGERISEFLKMQKEEVKNVFIKRYYFNEGVRDIAEELNASEVKIKSMLFHTRNRLKKFLKDKGVYL